MTAATGSLLSALKKLAAEHPNTEAFVASEGRRLTYASWLAEVDRAAARLRRSGARRIALHVEDGRWLAYPVLFLAAVHAELPVIVVRDIGRDEMNVLRAAGVDLLLSARADRVSIRRLRPSSPSEDHPSAFCVALLTSGTTGPPKLVAISEANLVDTLPRNAVEQQERCVYVAPVGTHLAQVAALRALASACTVVIALDASAQAIGSALATARRADVLTAPPHAVLRALSLAPPATHPLRISLTADVALPALLRRLKQTAPHSDIRNFYTTTEAYPAGVAGHWDPEHPWRLGHATSVTELAIGDDPNRPLLAGATGPIWLRSRGKEGRGIVYGNRTGAGGTWVATGDLGYLDSSGALTLVERESDVVKINAERVNLHSIADAILESGLVQDCAVVSAAGQNSRVIGALVVAVDADVTEDAIRRASARRLSVSEMPSRFVLVPTIPRNRGGKVARRLARDVLFGPFEDASDFTDASVEEDPRSAGPCSQPAEPTWGARAWADVLGISPVEAAAANNLLEYGADSLAFEEIAQRAADERQASVEIEMLLADPTATGLDRLVDRRGH